MSQIRKVSKANPETLQEELDTIAEKAGVLPAEKRKFYEDLAKVLDENKANPEAFLKARARSLSDDAIQKIAADDDGLFQKFGKEELRRRGLQPEAKEKTRTEKFQDAASRLSKIFGAEVKISRIADFNGVPTFEIKAGKNKEEAERAIDKLVIARKNAGLNKKDLAFGSDSEGNIRIYGGQIMNYESGPSDVIDSTFQKLEDPKYTKAFKIGD